MIFYLNLRMRGLEADHQVGDELGPDRAHRAEGEAGALQPLRRPRPFARLARRLLHRLQIGEHHPAQLGEMGVSALAVEERSAQLVLQLLDRTRQRRLAYVALLGGSGEVQRPRQGDEIADLLHLHGGAPSPAL
jgi:hypothetical protein